MPEPQRMPPYALVMFATGAPAIAAENMCVCVIMYARLVAAPRLALQAELLRVDVAALRAASARPARSTSPRSVPG